MPGELPDGWSVERLWHEDSGFEDVSGTPSDTAIAGADQIVVAHQTGEGEEPDYYVIHGADDLETLGDLIDYMMAGYEEA